MEKKAKNPVLQDDILRYKKNKFASSFALLALVFDCLYFTVLYAGCWNNSLYQPALGFSVIVNLLVLLIGFYSSEGIKGYNKKFSIVLLVLGAVQAIRIVYYPVVGVANGWLNDSNHYFGIVMNGAANATMMIIYLVGSAACFIVSAVQGYIVARRLEVFQKKLDNGEVSVEETIKELDAADEAKKSVAEQPAENVTKATAEKAEEPAHDDKVKASEGEKAADDGKDASSGEVDNG